MSDSCEPMDCSLPGSSVHRMFQARIPEPVTVSLSCRSFWPRDETHVSCVPCIAGRFCTTGPSGKPLFSSTQPLNSCVTSSGLRPFPPLWFHLGEHIHTQSSHLQMAAEFMSSTRSHLQGQGSQHLPDITWMLQWHLWETQIKTPDFPSEAFDPQSPISGRSTGSVIVVTVGT